MGVDRRRALIGILLALAAVRFLILPWIESQGDARDRLEVLTNRLDRSLGVVLNREAIRSSRQELEKANAAERSKFPESKDVSNFQLEAQQRVTGIIQSRTLQVEAFDWILNEPPGPNGFGYIRCRLLVRGDQRALAFLLGELEGNSPNISVREATFNFESPARGPVEAKTLMTLIADFYFRGKPEQ
jgi:hypothetical protein